MAIEVQSDERVHCIVLDGNAETNRRALVNAIRMGAQNSRMVVIGENDVIAATLAPLALSPAEVECAPVGTPTPAGVNVVSIHASRLG